MKSIWILCNPRSGSSFLCECLNNTNVFPKYVNPKLSILGNSRVTEDDMAFGEWLRLFDDISEFESFPPTCLKSIHHQYHNLFGSLGPEYIKSVIRDVNFLVLKRLDLVSHIISLYAATYTNKWHIWDKMGVCNYNNKLFGDIDYSILDKCIMEVILYQDNWSEFLSNTDYCSICYEDLCDDYIGTMSMISEAFDLEINTTTLLDAKNKNRLLVMREYYGEIDNKCRRYVEDAINKYGI